MDQTKYRVVFEGNIANGKELDAVKRNLMHVLKADNSTVEKLFSGKRIVIKRNANLENCNKIRATFDSAGAICDVYQEKMLNMNRNRSTSQVSHQGQPLSHTHMNRDGKNFQIYQDSNEISVDIAKKGTESNLRSRSKKSILKKLAISTLFLWILYGAGEMVIDSINYASGDKDKKMRDEIATKTSKAKASRLKFEEAFVKLVSASPDTTDDMKQILVSIDLIRKLQCEVVRDNNSLMSYLRDHKNKLTSKELAFLNRLSEVNISYQKAIESYLDSYKTILDYTIRYYDPIIKEQQPRLQNYGKLYSNYKTALQGLSEAAGNDDAYVDTTTGFVFPRTIAGFSFIEKEEYGDPRLGYGLNYCNKDV